MFEQQAARRLSAAMIALALVSFTPVSNAATGCEEIAAAMGAGLGMGPDGGGYVYSIVQSPSGSVYAGGIFDRSGFLTGVNNVAVWNGNVWNRLGTGLRTGTTNPGVTLGMAILTNGDLVAGGCFSLAGTADVGNVARWDGANWHPMAAGLQGCVFALAALPNGQIVAGGSFQRVLGTNVLVNHVARWTGTSWVPMAGGFTSPPNSDSVEVRSLAVTPEGHVIAAGRFQNAGGTLANGIARWDGVTWNAMGGGFNGTVEEVAVHPDGTIIAAGSISLIADPSQDYLLAWNGASWTQVGDQLDSAPVGMITRSNGDIIVMGPSNAGNVYIAGLGRWNGINWSPVSVDAFGVQTGVELADGSIVIGGVFNSIGEDYVWKVARIQFPESCPCDSIDFNNNGSRFEPTDIEAFFSVYGEGPCLPGAANLGCNDIDFNNDGSLFDPCDIESFLLVFSEGPCTPCGL